MKNIHLFFSLKAITLNIYSFFSRPFSSSQPCSAGTFSSYIKKHTFHEHDMKNIDPAAKDKIWLAKLKY